MVGGTSVDDSENSCETHQYGFPNILASKGLLPSFSEHSVAVYEPSLVSVKPGTRA